MLPAARRPYAGRRRAAKPSLRADVLTALTKSSVVKGGSALGLVAALGLATTLPGVAAEPAAAATSASAETAASVAALGATRGLATDRASRAGARAALGAQSGNEVAVTAPATLQAPSPAGLSGITAEAKPVVDTSGTSSSAAGGSAGGVVSGFDPSSFASAGAGLGLGYNAQRVYSSVRAAFGALTMGGYRAGDSGDHGAGRAVDIMCNPATGNAIAAFVQAHAGELNVNYVIWQQRIWFPGRGWTMMADRGSPTQNHYDHVHVSVN